MNENKVLTVAILGCGNRGCLTYGNLMLRMPEQYKVTTLCDKNAPLLKIRQKEYGVADENLFSDVDTFFQKKRADLIVIATLDDSHIELAIKALELGYDMLLEKPLSDSKEACERLLAAQKKYGGKVIVCHVLRYAPAFTKVKELLDEGKVGKLVSIQASEQVQYGHYSHSYVRGNWRNTQVAAPMILAKCCHDLDLLQYYAGSKCESISSVGDLVFFKPENKPEGSADRCFDCKYQDSCTYSAKTKYFTNEDGIWWVRLALKDVDFNDTEACKKAIHESGYGRCVFASDNDVVDHQLTQMTFENGVKANLIMMAFTSHGGRIMQFYGTHGQILLDEERKVIEVKEFGKPDVVIDTEKLILERTTGYGHGGGDEVMIKQLYDLITSEGNAETTLEASIESHVMGIYAEKSRLEGGKLYYVHK